MKREGPRLSLRVFPTKKMHKTKLALFHFERQRSKRIYFLFYLFLFVIYYEFILPILGTFVKTNCRRYHFATK